MENNWKGREIETCLHSLNKLINNQINLRAVIFVEQCGLISLRKKTTKKQWLAKIIFLFPEREPKFFLCDRPLLYYEQTEVLPNHSKPQTLRQCKKKKSKLFITWTPFPREGFRPPDSLSELCMWDFKNLYVPSKLLAVCNPLFSRFASCYLIKFFPLIIEQKYSNYLLKAFHWVLWNSERRIKHAARSLVMEIRLKKSKRQKLVSLC